ncbi:MAG: hypothetical protein ABSF69_18240 [Polyangiaceae bacterium]|jgi:hypothetical protein
MRKALVFVGIAAMGLGGCATTLRAPVPAIHSDAEVGAGSPAGFGCTVEGVPRVVANRVDRSAGVVAEAGDSRVWLHFSMERGAKSPALAVDPLSLDAVEGGESALSGFATAGIRRERLAVEITPVWWQSTGPWAADTGHVRPAVAEVHEASALHALQLRLRSALSAAPVSSMSGDARATHPVTARVDSESSAAVWSEGSIYRGLDVHVQRMDRHGRPIGSSVTLATDGRAFGTPTVAVGPSGRGVVAFLQATDHGFDLAATPIDCHVPASPDAAAEWAMQTARR